MAKVTAYRKDTGERVTVPKSWLTHPRLSKPFTTTPPAKGGNTPKAPTSAGTPNAPKEG